MSFFTHSDIQSQLLVTNQPQANLSFGSLDFNPSIPVHEKSLGDAASLENSHHHHHHHCERGQTSKHHSCHNIRLRRYLLPAIFVLVALGGLLAWSCVNWHGLPDWGVDLMGRALLDDSSNSNESPFIKNKLWLIVLIVGVVVVLLLAICICKVCCGGLGCLGCLCCGFCLAEEA